MFRAWLSEPTQELTKPLKIGITQLQLYKQIQGCFTTLMANSCREFDTGGDAWRYFQELMILELPTMMADIRAKRLARSALFHGVKVAV